MVQPMIQAIDDRVPVRFGSAETAVPNDALLVEGEAPAPAGRTVARFRLSPGVPGHRPGCVCCTPRGPVAEALGRLFLVRARAEVPFFDAVVAVLATPAGEAAVREALACDQLSAGRFRLAQR
jgi:hypothetical protein